MAANIAATKLGTTTYYCNWTTRKEKWKHTKKRKQPRLTVKTWDTTKQHE